MKFIHQSFRATLYLGVGVALGGCLSTTPQWDEHFGDAIHQITAMQTLNPDASANALCTKTTFGFEGMGAPWNSRLPTILTMVATGHMA